MAGSGLGFIGGLRDRAAVKRTDPAWVEAALGHPKSRFVQFRADRPMIAVGGKAPALAWTARRDLEPALDGVPPVLLGLGGAGQALFAAQSSRAPDEPLPDTVKLIDLRSLAVQGILAAPDMGLLAQARSLLHWHGRHRFCANCGAATDAAEAGYKRICAACRAEHFPRTDPVAIMVAVAGDRLLLGRGHRFAEGVYSALAGFVEPGESLEDAARREIAEEAGITVGTVRYVASQPWPFPSSLMIGVIGEALTTGLAIDRSELEDCRWFGKDEVRLMLKDEHPKRLKTPPPMAIAHHLIGSLV